jgi:hypothetical protein
MTNQAKKKDYDVGYSKTPEHSRFKKGQSGNPRGRPKGSKSFRMLLQEEWSRKVTVSMNGKPKKITVKRALVRREIQKALVDGDLTNLIKLGAFKEVEETQDYPPSFTLALDEPPPANPWKDNDFDYSQPQTRVHDSTAPE